MATTLKRLFWLSLLGGAGYAGWTVWNSRQSDDTGPAPEWPPLDPPPDRPAATAPSAPTVASVPTVESAGFAALPVDEAPSGPQRWVEPVDGACPPGYAIKANDNSGIYHVPGGRFYDRTVPERCYASADDAAADGYRAPKS